MGSSRRGDLLLKLRCIERDSLWETEQNEEEDVDKNWEVQE
jgi:hypothetical protein